MRNLGLLILVLLALPSHANASSVASIDTQICSGNQSISLLDTAVFECTGDFSLIGGSISSDTSITINSDGALILDNLSLNAPAINLNAEFITLGNGFLTNTSATNFGTPILNPRSGVDLTLGGISDIWKPISFNADLTVSFMNPGGTLTIVAAPVVTSGTFNNNLSNSGRLILLSPSGDIRLGGGALITASYLSYEIGYPSFISGVAVTADPVPEPSNFILMFIGFTALLSRKANWQKLTKKLNGLFITNAFQLNLNRCLVL